MRGRGARLVVILPYAWLGFFFLVPCLVVLRISLSDPATAQPPYLPALAWPPTLERLAAFLSELDLENFETLADDDLYWRAALNSLRIALVATTILILMGYPIAHAMARAPARLAPLLVALVILPFWTSFLIRIYAWIGILKPEGWLNAGLAALGWSGPPLALLNTDVAVLIGLVYAYLPFMILPLYAVLAKLDPALLEAARDLGASRTAAFWTVTVPLSLPGILAGALICFIPIVGEFVVPELLGGTDTVMIGRVLWNEFFQNRDWPLASAVAIVMLIMLVVPIVIYREIEARRFEGGR